MAFEPGERCGWRFHTAHGREQAQCVWGLLSHTAWVHIQHAKAYTEAERESGHLWAGHVRVDKSNDYNTSMLKILFKCQHIMLNGCILKCIKNILTNRLWAFMSMVCVCFLVFVRCSPFLGFFVLFNSFLQAKRGTLLFFHVNSTPYKSRNGWSLPPSSLQAKSKSTDLSSSPCKKHLIKPKAQANIAITNNIEP